MPLSASRVRLSVVAGGVVLLAVAQDAGAQDARPPAAVEALAGYARGWGEDLKGHHVQVGTGLRFYLSPRVSLTPRVRLSRLFDPDEERTDLNLETALMFEFRRPAHGRPRIVSPFVLVSGGLRIHRYPATRFSRASTHTDGPLTGLVVGARLFLPARGRMYVAPEVGYANLATVAVPVTFGMALGGQDDRAPRCHPLEEHLRRQFDAHSRRACAGRRPYRFLTNLRTVPR